MSRSMRSITAILVAGLYSLAIFGSSIQAAPAPNKVAYVFVIDTSLSMVGQSPGAVDIMPKVKETFRDYLSMSPNTFVDSRIVVATFHDGMQSIREWSRVDRPTLTAISDYVDSLKATGRRTLVSKSMRQVFDWMNTKRASDETAYFYVYTDGLEEEPGKTVADMVSEFRAVRQTYDWLYYFALGVDVPAKAQSAFTASEQASIVQVPGGQKPPSIIELTIPRLNFGDLADQLTREQVFSPRMRLTGLSGLKLAFRMADSDDLAYLRSKGADIQVTPTEVSYADRVKLSLSPANKDNIPPGLYSMKCVAETSSPAFIINNRTFEVAFSSGDVSYAVSLKQPDGTSDAKSKLGVTAGEVWEKPFTGSFVVSVTPSPLAQKFASSLSSPEITVEMGSSAASGFVSLGAGSGNKPVVLPKSGGDLTATVSVPKGTIAGRYDGKVKIVSADARIKGSLVKDLGDSSYEVPFSVVVAKKPMPTAVKGLIGLLVLCGLGAAALLLTSTVKREPIGGVLTDWGASLKMVKPSLRDVSLQCLEPRSSRRTHDFHYLRDERIGAGSDWFPEMSTTLRLRAAISNGQRCLVVSCESPDGVFGLRRPGERDFSMQKEARVYADDMIKAGAHVLRIDSSDLLGGGSEVE